MEFRRTVRLFRQGRPAEGLPGLPRLQVAGGLDYIAFRNLADLGYNEAEIKAIAAEYEVMDGPDDEGEMFMRPARRPISSRTRIGTTTRRAPATTARCRSTCR